MIVSKNYFQECIIQILIVNCILDPIFQYYSAGLKEFIFRSPQEIKTINATEGGCIFGDRIESMKLEEFLIKFD